MSAARCRQTASMNWKAWRAFASFVKQRRSCCRFATDSNAAVVRFAHHVRDGQAASLADLGATTGTPKRIGNPFLSPPGFNWLGSVLLWGADRSGDPPRSRSGVGSGTPPRSRSGGGSGDPPLIDDLGGVPKTWPPPKKS